MSDKKLNDLIEKLYFLSHVPNNLGNKEISITFTQEELDYLVLFLINYKQIKEK